MSDGSAAASSRAGRRAAYERLRAERPQMFANPPGTPIEIVFDEKLQDEAAGLSAEAQRDRGLPAEFGDIGVLYEDSYLKLVKDAVRFPSGRLGTYIRTFAAVEGEGVVVFATAADGRIALVRHYRHGCREWHWEFPRGFAEPGLGGAQNAAKEMQEEVGVAAGTVNFLGWLDGQDSDHKVGVYHVTADLPEEPEVTAEAAEEGIDGIRLVTARQLESMIRAGELTDMFTLSAYAIAVAGGVVARP